MQYKKIYCANLKMKTNIYDNKNIIFSTQHNQNKNFIPT